MIWLLICFELLFTILISLPQRNTLPHNLFRFLLVHVCSLRASTKKSVILLHPLIEVFGIPLVPNGKSTRLSRDLSHFLCTKSQIAKLSIRLNIANCLIMLCISLLIAPCGGLFHRHFV